LQAFALTAAQFRSVDPCFDAVGRLSRFSEVSLEGVQHIEEPTDSQARLRRPTVTSLSAPGVSSALTARRAAFSLAPVARAHSDVGKRKSRDPLATGQKAPLSGTV
jgi:hypothetical protein